MKGLDKLEDEPSPHPSFSFISAPSAIYLFGPLTYALHGKPFFRWRQPKHSMHEELWCFNKDFYAAGI